MGIVLCVDRVDAEERIALGGVGHSGSPKRIRKEATERDGNNMEK